MFQENNAAFTDAIREECKGGFDDQESRNRTWNEMWQSVFEGDSRPVKETIEQLIEVDLHARLEACDEQDEDFEERYEHLSGLLDRWNSDEAARAEAVDDISKEVFRDLADDMEFSNFESVLGDDRDFEKDRLEIAIANGFDIHGKDDDQATLLHHCSSMKAANFLMDQGLDPRAADKDGDLPADWAKVNGLYRLAGLYESKTAELDATEQSSSLMAKTDGKARSHEATL